MQKFNLIGSSQYISTVWGFGGAIIAVAVVISGVIMIARWLIKPIIKHACDSGSGWAFKTAVAVTGYAYLPDLVFAIIGLVVVFYAVPQLTLDTSNLEAARHSLANFSAQLRWLKWLYTLPSCLSPCYGNPTWAVSHTIRNERTLLAQQGIRDILRPWPNRVSIWIRIPSMSGLNRSANGHSKC